MPAKALSALDRVKAHASANTKAANTIEAKRKKRDDKATQKKIRLAHQQLKKKYGESMVQIRKDEVTDVSHGGFTTGFQEIDDILTGSLDADLETVPGSGIGLPKGRMIEFYGPEASGKTSLALMVAANVQAEGGVVGFCDVEKALDMDHAEKLGVNVDELLYSLPDYGEEALSQVDMMVKQGIDLIICDSVAALVPKKEADGDMGDAQMGSQARLMSQACRKLTRRLKPGGPTIIFINQTRQKVGVMFGDPETVAGGNALKFYASIRASIRFIKKIRVQGKDGEQKTIGVRVKMQTEKNKVAPPHRHIIYDIMYNTGVRIPTNKELRAEKAAMKAKYGKK